jgi:methylthioribulose-1-phosphate dehydratase
LYTAGALETHAPPAADDPRVLLAATARDLYGRGWMAGTAGNLSLRLPDGSFWISASGKPKGSLGVEDFLRVSPGGEVLERGHPGDLPSAETCIHQAVYSLFPAAGACYHVHTVASNLVPRLPGLSLKRPPGSATVEEDRRDLEPEPGELPLPPLEMLKGFGVREQRPSVGIAVFPNHVEVPAIAVEVAARFRVAPPRLPAFLIRDHGLTVWAESGPAAQRNLELLEFIFAFMVAASSAGAAGPAGLPPE